MRETLVPKSNRTVTKILLSNGSNVLVQGGKLLDTECSMVLHVSSVQTLRGSEEQELAHSPENRHFTCMLAIEARFCATRNVEYRQCACRDQRQCESFGQSKTL